MERRMIRPLILVGIGGAFFILALVVLLVNQFQAAPAPTSTKSSSTEDIKRISLADAKAAYDLKQAVFVDTRGEPYYSQGHIPGAVDLPYTDLETRYQELNPQDWIILYCT